MRADDLERLIQTVTDLVLARLKDWAPTPPDPPTLTVLWPVPTPSRDAILAGAAAFRSDDRQVRWLVRADLLDELIPLLPVDERVRCHALGQAPVQAILADLREGDAVLLAAAHFEAARLLLELRDDHDWVHVLLQAHLAGRPVVVCEDLLTPASPAATNPVAREAEGLLRQLRQAGYRLTPSRELARLLKDMTRTCDPGLQDAPGLITEQDVENLVRAGHRELRLHARTLVTPLAQGRAAELGLALLRPEHLLRQD